MIQTVAFVTWMYKVAIKRGTASLILYLVPTH